MIKDGMNPWAGLASYEDPQNAEYDLKFCGRNDDSYDVARLVMGNVFVTLYGKSGIGKTSLLNAGVFPELREEGFTPLSVRLGIRDEENPKSFQRIIIDAVEQVIKNCDVIEVVPEQCDQTSKDFLWNYFARHRFYDKNEEQTIPVIVLDQFEEVFRKDKDEAEILLRQIDYLNDKDHALDACEVNGLAYRYEQNFRFTVSIREDDLYRLEDSLDNCYLPALKRNRYRLRSLSEEEARKVILVPGEGLFRPEEEERIVKRVIDATRQKGDDSISTNLLSLICNRLYNDCKSAGSEYITCSFMESFMKGNPIERFYNEATKDFSDKEKEYFENHLVDSNGRRNSVSESDFMKHVARGQKLLEGDSRILQRTSTSSDGASYRIELIHDSFCDPLVWQKEKRGKRRRLKQLMSVSLITVICIFAVVFAHVNWKLLVNKARFISEKGMELLEDQDSYTARLLALEVLPKNFMFRTMPYVQEAEELLRESVNSCNAVFKGHTDRVTSSSFNPNGSQIVSASKDRSVRIWDATTGAQLGVLEGHRASVNSASFSPDGSRIVSTSEDKTVRIWDATTGVLLKVLEGHVASVNSASFGPNGSQIVSASKDRSVRIWDATTGARLGVLEGHMASVNSASFSPDGSRIVSTSEDKTVRIWDATTGAQLGVLEGHMASVNSASFSPDGSQIVSSSRDKTVRIWDATTGAQLGVLEGHMASVNSASFSPDGSQIVSSSRDQTVRIWDATTGVLLQVLEGHVASVNSASFSPKGSLVASASDDGIVRIWDTVIDDRLRILRRHTSWVTSASFSPDSSRIVAFTHNEAAVRVLDVATDAELHILNHGDSWVTSASFSSDGSRIVSSAFDGTVRIWDAATGVELLILNQGNSWVTSASFSPDGSRIVSTSDDKTVRIWDAMIGIQLQVLRGHRSLITSASFSPDGSRIVSSAFDGTVRIWDTATGDQLQVLRGHRDEINSASFSPDGSRIVSASNDCTVRIWDTATGDQLQVLKRENLFSVKSAFFTPDGSRIVLRYWDGTIRIWDFSPLQDLIDQTREQFKNRKLTPEERRKYYLE